MKTSTELLAIDTHPVQYRAPIYRMLQQQMGIRVTVLYGSDFSIVGYRDREFQASFAWDTDLLSGYHAVFLTRVPRKKDVQEMQALPLAFRTALKIRKALRESNPKVTLILGYCPFFHLVAFYFTRNAGYPIIFRADTADHALPRSPVKAYLRDFLLRRLYNKCAKLLYIGQYSLEHFKRLGCPDEKLIFSPYCVDPSPFQCNEEHRLRLRKAARRSLNVSERNIILLFSGKLIPRKGPDLLMAAVKKLSPEIHDKIVILFMGNGELRVTLKNLAGYPPLTQSRFIGFQNQTALSSYYHAADLLVLPSLSEVWGLVVNEALHHGVPCVVSKGVGAALDLIRTGVTGEIFETGSIASLSASIQRGLQLINQPEIRRKCREVVREYSIERAAEGIAKAYRCIVERREPTPHHA